MSTILKSVNKVLRPLGMMLKRIRPGDIIKDQTMQGAIQRSREVHGINPATVIDVGAAEGKWTLMAQHIWNQSNFVLFEPLEERKETLLALRQKDNKIYVVNKAAGAVPARIDFYVTNDLDGSGIAGNGADTTLRKVDVGTIDQELSKLNLKGPYVVKLDTHGYESPILEGARQTLRDTHLLIIECYGFQIAPGSLLFWEMCQHLRNFGFRLIDIVDVMLRRKDKAFWQCDAFFISENADCFKSNTFN